MVWFIVGIAIIGIVIYGVTKNKKEKKLKEISSNIINSLGCLQHCNIKVMSESQKECYSIIENIVNSNFKSQDNVNFSERINNCKKYDTLLQEKINSLRLKDRAFAYLNIDEEQVKEIDPICIGGYCQWFNDSAKHTTDNQAMFFCEADKTFRSRMFLATYVFMSDSQVYIYSCKFDMCSDFKEEHSYEYFYKDITEFVKYNDISENNKSNVIKSGCLQKEVEINTKELIIYKGFRIAVPNGYYNFYVRYQDGLEESINAIQQKIREKSFI